MPEHDPTPGKVRSRIVEASRNPIALGNSIEMVMAYGRGNKSLPTALEIAMLVVCMAAAERGVQLEQQEAATNAKA